MTCSGSRSSCIKKPRLTCAGPTLELVLLAMAQSLPVLTRGAVRRLSALLPQQEVSSLRAGTWFTPLGSPHPALGKCGLSSINVCWTQKICYGGFKEGVSTSSGFRGIAQRRLGKAFQDERRTRMKGWSG